jgi:GNAT superfamily N-acetyltransferase
MDVDLIPSASAVPQEAQAWLAERPVGANVVASALAAQLTGEVRYDDCSWAVVRDGGEVAGVAMHTPPHPPYLPPMGAPAAVALAQAWAAAGRRADGVRGDVPAASAFADRWCELTGVDAVRFCDECVHVLDVLRPTSGVPGILRPPGPPERAVARTVLTWVVDFLAEALPGRPHQETEESVSTRLTTGRLLVWEDVGRPVSMAGWRPPHAGVGRVGPVYTPPEHRGRGYAAAVTVAASRAVLAAGAERCMLYTDLANATSNRLYARLGYRRVADVAEWRFD